MEFGDNSIKRYSKQYLVSDCRFLFARPFNGFTPEGRTRCERVEVTVIAPGKDDHGLIEWFSAQSVQNGRIVISLSNEGKDSESDTDESETAMKESEIDTEESESDTHESESDTEVSSETAESET